MAVMDVLASGEVEVPAETLWALVRDFGTVDWMLGVTKVELEGDGVGMVRAIHAGGGDPIREKLTSLDDDAMRLGYTITHNNPLPVSRYEAHVRVVGLGGDRSRLEWGCAAEGDGSADDATTKASIEGMYGMLIGWVKTAAET